MPILPELYPDAPQSPALLGAALRRLSHWWNLLLSIGLTPGLSHWDRKRVRLLNGIAGIGLAVLVSYALAFANSPDRVTFRLSVLGIFLNLGTLGLNYLRRYDASAYYTIITVALYYSMNAIGKKNDGSEFILITNSIMTMLFFRQFRQIVVLFLLNVAGFFAVQYATTVVPPFMHGPQSVYVHDVNVFLFILTLFLVVAHFRAENRYQEVLLVRRNQELHDSLTELHATQEQLVQREKMAFLGELTAGIAHELQNPLAFMKSFAEVSTDLVEDMDGIGGPERTTALQQEILAGLKQNLQQISQHGQRATAIIKGMLEHSRSGAGPRELTDLNALVQESLDLAYNGLRVQDPVFAVRLSMAFDAGLPALAVVAPDLRRVLVNVCTNGLHALRERHQAPAHAAFTPELTLTTRAVPGAVEIRVRDNGTGMPEHVQARIFQPFFTTKPMGEGTGLGLSISFDIVTKGHGGTFAVSSTEGVGTEFVICLPQA